VRQSATTSAGWPFTSERAWPQERDREVLVSSTVKDLVVGSRLEFSDRGEHELKGVPGAWRIYALAHEAPAEPPLEPAADQMTPADRATVRVARRAPGLLRTIGRLTMRERAQP
jgi:hypothetical protein